MTGAMLLALRESRHLTRRELARELRRASGEPLATELARMIWAWENGRHKPSELYMRAYRRVFPELGNSTGDLAAVAADLTRRAGELPDAGQVTALEAAALARVPPEKADAVRDMAAAALAHLELFHERLRQIAEALGNEDGR